MPSECEGIFSQSGRRINLYAATKKKEERHEKENVNNRNYAGGSGNLLYRLRKQQRPDAEPADTSAEETADEEQAEETDAATTETADAEKSTDTAIMVVSFGTSYNDSRDITIGAIENAIADAFPQYEVRRAFTSQIIIDKLKERDGLEIDNVQEALDRAAADGIKNLIVQPTHLMTAMSTPI